MVYQALALEVPLLASFSSGASDLIDEKCGFIIPADLSTSSPDEYARYLVGPVVELKSNPAKWLDMAKAARLAVQTRSSSKHVSASFMAVLDEAKKYDGRESTFHSRLVQAATNLQSHMAPHVDLDGTSAMHMTNYRDDEKGRFLQRVCAETNAAMTQWIDNVISPKACPGSEDAQITLEQDLFALARFQCAQWCIFDLRKPQGGFEFHGNCFSRFSSRNHTCEVSFPDLRIKARHVATYS
jgi:hypothetical protein